MNDAKDWNQRKMMCVLVMLVRTGSPASIIDEVGLSVPVYHFYAYLSTMLALQTPTSDRHNGRSGVPSDRICITKLIASQFTSDIAFSSRTG